MPAGRPSDYTEELAQTICDQIMQGNSLRKICEADGMPDRGTVLRWVAKNNEFRNQYAQAMNIRAEVIFDEILDIADDGTRDYEVDEGGKQTPNYDHIQRSRLRVDTRKWVVSKMLPKKYGPQKVSEGTEDEPGLDDPNSNV